MKPLNFLHAIGMLGGATLVVGGTVRLHRFLRFASIIVRLASPRHMLSLRRQVGPKDGVRGAGGVGAGGIQGLIEPSSSPPALDMAAEKAATLFPLDGMVSTWRHNTAIILSALVWSRVRLLV